jgi:hypothetical protein
MRRGMVGTSPQHRTKSSIRRDVPRISDDRALKVAGAYPGRPVASRKLVLLIIQPDYQGEPVDQNPGVGGLSRPDHRRAQLRKG